MCMVLRYKYNVFYTSCLKYTHAIHCHLSKTPGFNSRGLQTEVCGICSSNNLVELDFTRLYKTCCTQRKCFSFWKSSETVLNLNLIPFAGHRNDQSHNGTLVSENIYSKDCHNKSNISLFHCSSWACPTSFLW